ncbi:FAD/NAD(P)-binding domain-containing protein [Mollisia scopiformis]|uniref:FAD/NAD(P)-binding domain-containing protein n=1 Tax=Mollisia scopiformis TaxID=149040 RepID=A0A132B970_MOLSC|nr:FAD/NAD(P)-binding domain-containing protein [Mollisia scopiformis]KUJ08217.1 FAD/NAD(P)-binding domain-containing protein [Mollisia scopiformis]
MTINIAIVGGGIAGLCLARGLVRHPHLQVTVYEATQRYLDIGGGLAFHGNAMRALELIDPELQAEYFRRATVMNERDVEMATQVLVGDAVAEDGGSVLLAELGKAKGRKTVARSDLLEGLLSLIPGGVVKFGKRLAQIEEKSTNGAIGATNISLTFKDGTTATADVVIGCDGVHSVIRKYLLGADHPAVGLKNHDAWQWIRRSVPAEEVMKLNERLLSYVPIFCGHGAYMNCLPTHFGKTLNVAVVQISKDSRLTVSSEKDGVQETPDIITPEAFSHWTKDARDIATLALRDPSTEWKLEDHDPAPFYSRGRICMIGDAAHATMPFNGQGAAQSIEDAALLTALFEHVTKLEQVEKALGVYDELRRPRTQKIAELSRQFGRMYAFAEEGVGDDLGKMRAILGAGAKYTNDVDLKALNEEAVRNFLAK